MSDGSAEGREELLDMGRHLLMVVGLMVAASMLAPPISPGEMEISLTVQMAYAIQ